MDKGCLSLAAGWFPGRLSAIYFRNGLAASDSSSAGR